MSADTLQSLLVLLLGFSTAGLLSTGYQLLTARPASFNIFGDGAGPVAVAHVPFLVFAAPFIIMRNALVGRRPGIERFFTSLFASLIAGAWSLISGKVMVLAVLTLGLV